MSNVYHKTIPARRFVRRQHIARKRYIERSIYGISEYILVKEPIGKLSKNKVHYSSNKCYCKSTTDNGAHTNSKRNYIISDRRKLISTDNKLYEYTKGYDEMDVA